MSSSVLLRRIVAFRLPFSVNFASTYQHILVDKKGADQNIGVITLNRPKALNALCDDLMSEVTSVLNTMEADKSIATVILTGSEKSFAAGADIKEMQNLDFVSTYTGSFLSHWSRVSAFKKPLIAAVNGFALGGGCELAMMCDIIYAGEKAKFGQPEIALGTIPGGGGTQRLIRTVGKSKAMEMCLSGDMMSAAEALQLGLVSKVVQPSELMDACIKLAERIGKHSKLTTSICKEAINNAYEMTLHEGLHFEKRLFHATFATNDRKEGMTAFTEKRPAKFTDS